MSNAQHPAIVLKLLAFALWLMIVDVGLLLILHGLGYIALPFPR